MMCISALQDCLEMTSIGSRTDGLPESSEAIEGPRVQRQVWLPQALHKCH